MANKITKDTLYTCYNTFYTPSNMLMVISGDFVPEKLLEEIKKRLIKNEDVGEIKRIYPEEPKEINKKQNVVTSDRQRINTHKSTLKKTNPFPNNVGYQQSSKTASRIKSMPPLYLSTSHPRER